MRAWLICWTVSVVFLSTTSVSAGPHGTVVIPRVPDGKITIDGSLSDWPLGSYTTPSRQPEFPEGRDSVDGTDALGDHILFELERADYFGAPSCNVGDCSITNNEPIDFGSTIYMAYDSNALYFMGVFLDDIVRSDLDTTEFGGANFLNDGFEIFLDVLNDTDDNTVEFANPPWSNFDDAEPNLDDLQLTFGVNENFPSGARQQITRTGRPELQGGDGPGEPWTDFLAVIAEEINGPGGVYRDALTAFGQDIAATLHDDMRAIGAPNPEIADNPDVTFPGYVMELAMPFGFADLDGDGAADDDFVPALGRKMGFQLFWNDFDADEEGAILRIKWSQGPGIFTGLDWGEIEFGAAIGPDGDYNGNGELDAGDLDVHTQFIKDGDLAGDVNGDGVTNTDDRAAWTETLQNSYLGDSNFDGEFSSSDLVTVFTPGKYESGAMATYAEGDWNGDMEFNSSDLVAAFGVGGYELGPRAAVAAVPEPTSFVMIALGALGLLRRRRNCQR